MTPEQILRELQLATWDLEESEAKLKSAHHYYRQAAHRIKTIYRSFDEALDKAQAKKSNKQTIK